MSPKKVWIAFLSICALLAIAGGAVKLFAPDAVRRMQEAKHAQGELNAERDLREKEAHRGLATLKSMMRNSDSFVLESALIMSDGQTVCYTYRSENGFGGMNRENAVLSAGTLRISRDDWDRLCAGKSGQKL
jgi:hypothetical protein